MDQEKRILYISMPVIVFVLMLFIIGVKSDQLEKQKTIYENAVDSAYVHGVSVGELKQLQSFRDLYMPASSPITEYPVAGE